MSRYRVLDKLGSGAGGTVYRAVDLELKRDVAIKVMPVAAANNAELLARFQREVQLLSSLSHPNIVRIYDALEIDGSPAYSMEIVTGATLAELALEQGPLPFDRALSLVGQAADALALVHSAQLCHRDVKPANLMVDDDDRLRVMDFGLVRDLNATMLTAIGAPLGTPRYMAPEVMEGHNAGPAADVYSLGVVLHELVTGKRAYQASSIDSLVAAVLSGPPLDLGRARPDTPHWLVQLQRRAVARDPKQRPTMSEYRDGLARRAAGLSSVSNVVSTPGSAGGPSSSGGIAGTRLRTPGASAGSVPPARAPRAIAVFLAGLAAVAAIALRPSSPPPPPAAPKLPVLAAPEAQLPRALKVKLPGGLAAGAELRVRAGDERRTLPAAGAELVVEDLPPATDVALELVTADGRALAEPFVVRTPQLAPVTNLACFASERDVLVDFDAPPGPPLIVEVRRRADGRAIGQQSAAMDAKVFHAVIGGLAPDTEYLLSARTPQGWPGLAPYPFRTRPPAHRESIAEMVGELKRDWSASELLANFMVAWPDSRIVKPLREVLRDRSPRTATGLRTIARAVERLRDVECAIALEPFLALANAEPERAAVMRAIAQARHPRAAEIARPYAETSRDFGVLEATAYALATSHDPADVDRIAGCARRFPRLVNFVHPMVLGHREQARHWFERWLAEPRSQAMQPAAVEGLHVLGGPEDAAILAAALARPPPEGYTIEWLHEVPLRALVEIGGDTAAATVETLARAHPDSVGVTWAMVRMRRPAFAPMLRARLASALPALRRAACAGLAYVGTPEDAQSVRTLILDPDPSVADTACWSAARRQDASAVPALIARACGPTDGRGMAAWALARVGATEAAEPLAAVLRTELARDPGHPSPRLIALLDATGDLPTPASRAAIANIASGGGPAPLRELARGAAARAGRTLAGERPLPPSRFTLFPARPGLPAAASYPFVPVVSCDFTGLRVYPGDVIDSTVLGCLTTGDRLSRADALTPATEACPKTCTSLRVRWQRFRVNQEAHNMFLPTIEGELAVSLFEVDTLGVCSEQQETTGGVARLLRR